VDAKKFVTLSNQCQISLPLSQLPSKTESRPVFDVSAGKCMVNRAHEPDEGDQQDRFISVAEW
jgi:hypothetical protein